MTQPDSTQNRHTHTQTFLPHPSVFLTSHDQANIEALLLVKYMLHIYVYILAMASVPFCMFRVEHIVHLLPLMFFECPILISVLGPFSSCVVAQLIALYLYTLDVSRMSTIQYDGYMDSPKVM